MRPHDMDDSSNLERRGHIALAHAQPARRAQRDQPRGEPGDGRRSSTRSRPTTTLRAVVLTGAGEVFSAGADLKVVAQGRGMDIARGKGGFAGIVNRDFPKPIIAAVNGPALAGGFEIVLSCDLVVAADTARFGIPEVQRGLDGRGRRPDPPARSACRSRSRSSSR